MSGLNKTKKYRRVLNLSEAEPVIYKRRAGPKGWGCQRFKPYIMPSGKTLRVQGYEPYALDILLKTYNETELIVGNRKESPLIFWLDTNNKIHSYYVDIYIPSEKRMIEVKSTWTYKQPYDNGKLTKIPERCIKEGYKYEYWVFDQKLNRTIIDKF